MELSILCMSYISCNPSCCEGKADCSHQPWAWSAFATKTLNCPAFLSQSCGTLPISCSSDETHFSVSCVLFTEAICLSHVAEWSNWDGMRCSPLMCFQTGASLQQKADGWKEKVNDTRVSRSRTPTHSDQEAQVPALYQVYSFFF